MRFIASLLFALCCSIAQAASVIPTDAQMPGTQPLEVKSSVKHELPTALDSVRQCSFCHGDYNKAVEPLHTWQGSMMSQAARDPLFWAQLAIAEQDFDGAGDVCIRCHMQGAWLSGRSTPTDGSSVTPHDANGVECDVCHRLTNPNQTEHQGVQNPPFIANDGKTPAEGYFGSAQTVLFPGIGKLGPYSNAVTKHPSLNSKFHRSVDFCGTCHDVSNPVVGDLAPGNGAQVPLAAGTFSGVPGSPVEGKAAFNNPPYKYGVVERTYSEYKASLFPTTLVSNYNNLPSDLKNGAVKAAYDAALLAGKGGNYEDGDPRFFSCQTCHMMPVVGEASNRVHNKPVMRKDQALHDLTGANYWIPRAILCLDPNPLDPNPDVCSGTLRVGSGLKPWQRDAMKDGIVRAKASLSRAASLSVTNNLLKVTNLTGHKLITGYPEGRRMWLNMKWYNASGALLREDGKYGPLNVTINGTPKQVNTILDLSGANTRIYENHGAVTQKWAQKLIASGKPSNLPLMFDRVTGAVTKTLGQLSSQSAATYGESFHFILNNYIAKDNRIPPYGMRYDEALKRSSLPVPASQFGNAGPGGTYRYWDEISLYPPSGAVRATIDLLYQPTSWEYIQFLALANNGSNTFLANEGSNLLDAWLNTGMAEPHVMASTTWTGISLAPTVTGIWPGNGPKGTPVFVFGSNFVPMTTKVSVNGTNAPMVQVIDPTLLVFMLPAVNTTSPVPVVVTTANGSASTSFGGVAPSTLSITGMWPGTTKVGNFVFVFGSGYKSAATMVKVNGTGARTLHVVGPSLLIFSVPSGATTGKVTVTTTSPAAVATSSADLVVQP